ncbi:hypothetical protein ACP4OV_001554 [Aristida adscensionis]
MENPSFVPELVLDKPTLKSPEPPAPEVYGSCASLKASEFLNFEITGRPFIPMSNSGHDVGLDHQDASGAKKSGRRCVTHGERHALLSRQNKQFEANIGSKIVPSENKDPFMEVEDKNGSNSISQPGVTNTESIKTDYMTGASTPSQPHANNDGDNDGVIFEDDDDEEEEGYLFIGQDEDIEEDAQMDDANLESSYVPNMNDPYDKVYSNMPQDTHNLEPVQNCGYCNAKMFQYEPEGFCCRGGKIQLVEPETPPELMRLWSSADADAKHFRENVRFFNGHFSFTSLYCNLDSKTTDTRNGGIYTFRAHGQMYHNIRSFGRDGTEPNHLELYFYDDDPSLKHRFHKCRQEQFDKDREVIKGLARILRGNPYAENLRSLGQVDDLEDYRVTFNLDQRGELGWHSDIPKVGMDIRKVLAAREKKRSTGNISTEDPDSPGNKCVSVRDYYCYKFQMRPGIFNLILHGKRLFQQFAVDTYIKIESSRLDYIRHNQRDLRAELYQGLVDALHAGEGRSDKVGKRTVLSTSFIGGPRDMRRRYMDAIALVRKYGKPDIFLTMTCNPNWDEIKREIYPGQIPQDRSDLVVRVFRAKLEELKKRLLQYDILGKVRAYVYVVEFQKRGLPHAHFLLIMQNKYKLTCPEQYDLLISAEIPDKKKYPELHKMVIKHMMHGPCGALNRNCPCCIGRQSCKNNYPRAYSETTIQGKDSYPIYRRRKNGKKENVRNAQLDNAWVVPYNPYLLRLFNCHINVEACGSIKAVKYLFKYIYKGHDRASIAVREAGKVDDHENIDEIKQYRDARWVTPPEALWRIYGFDLSKNSPPVLQLQLHLPGMHMVSFQPHQDIKKVVNREGVEKSMLTAYFEANRLDPHARGILYRDFPEHYTWQANEGKYWKRRVQKKIQVGRIVSAHPAEGERYYLRVILNHVTGATSFEDLRTVDGVVLPTFREAAERRGLIESDNTLDECLTEATMFQMPSSLRRLFATILVFCEPSDVRGLWQKHLDAMSEDYQRNNQSKFAVEQLVLIDIRNILQSMGKDIKSFPLPKIDKTYDDTNGIAREILEEARIKPTVDDMSLSESLNQEQRAAYDEIITSINNSQGGVFFVDGPGGTGKTYLYRALLATVRHQDKIAVATATSGVAASIMPGGRTAHSRFKIPLSINNGAYCSFTKQSGTAKLLRTASLIIWDEASMTKRQAIEALDNSMRDIMEQPELPFGGKTIVFGGDFRQVLPVVRKGSRNMRAKSDPWFAEYLLRIGGGTEATNNDGDVHLPDEICLPYTGEDSDLDGLIDCIFPRLNENMEDTNYITSRAILATRNDWVDIINMKMMERFQGDEMVYHSFDTAVDDPHNYYPSEFLNSLSPNGLPPHVLKLKIGCPVILLRNIDPANGLCNGTRLVVRGFQRNIIDAEIILGQHAGRRIFLPRIPLCPSDDEMFPFQFKRKQFPISLSFAMTVNKAQGQTIPNVGVYLREPVFSHGQLYVALSRATARSNIKILAVPVDDMILKKEKKKVSVKRATYTKNIVYKEVLTP